MNHFKFIWIFGLILSCNTASEKETSTQVTPQNDRPLAYKTGKIFEKKGEKWLYGGEDSLSHFNISNCILNDTLFHYGIGREKFPALLTPEFMSKSSADTVFSDSTRFLLLDYKNTVKAYSIPDLTRCEVVNDVVEGVPIMAAYCILADLGAIYPRMINGKEYTFALSGYTYYDPSVWNGLDGFVFWDRETESLWWPLIGKAVSGRMNGTELKVMDEQYWKQTTWREIKQNHDEVQVLVPNQDFERPTSWKRYTN